MYSTEIPLLAKGVAREARRGILYTTKTYTQNNNICNIKNLNLTFPN